MTQVYRRPEVSARYEAWLDLVRSACLTLEHSSSGMVRSASLSKGFAGGQGEDKTQCILVAQRLAEEYGLATEIEERGSFVTIRFIRRDSDAEPAAKPTDSTGITREVWRRLCAITRRGEVNASELPALEKVAP
ncbi:MAG TPA: hypothetical protein VJB57_08685 [Dehalococcoidia bacterium]|nr:hypothetical protein [Dehalococcoidia bacterium]